VTKNSECHNHSQLELMLNKLALSVFSNWGPQKLLNEVTEELNNKKQREQMHKSELLVEEDECRLNN
jgi:hypothetical protein